MSFTRPQSINNAYLGKHALDLERISSEQVLDLYVARGITIPVVLSSTLHALLERNGASLTMLAASLRLPHQLVAQRVRKLIDAGLVIRSADPNDKRRFVLTLTDQGRDQAEKLKACMADMADIYGDLYAEINCDLPAKLQAAIQRLQARPLTERFAEKGLLPDYERTTQHVSDSQHVSD